ncbi:MAG: cobalamin-binding protein [Firmicutes bacterium]|jgi:methylmalonyl-CoA mutase cobalamin-binding domain/chain|nr:cobalamin-binding protein [Bacillota bacterium]
MKYEQLAQKIADLEAEAAIELVLQLVESGEEPAAILAACRKGMEGVGKRFESGEYFVADLMLSASSFQEIMQLLGPALSAGIRQMESKGKVVIATVKEDIHDIGKNLVIAMLSANGFEVIDLGVNVDPDVICKAVIREQPHILALSCLLTSTLDGIEATIAELAKQGLRDKVKVIVGGAPLTAKLAQQFGADAYGEDAYDAVPQCLALMEGV